MNFAKKKINISTLNLALILYAVSIFLLKGYCYFRWDSYANTVVKYLAAFINYGGLIFLFFISCRKYMPNSKKKQNITVILLSIVLIVYIDFTGKSNFSYLISDVELLMAIFSLAILPDEKKQKLFEYIFIVFTILILPSFIYYSLSLLGIDIPHSILRSANEGKILYGWYYNHYFFGLTTVQAGHMSRYCGIFDEAGFVGSIAALLLCAGYHGKINKKWYILLAIEGIFTLSMAFYLLMFIFFVLILIQKRSFKNLGILTACILIIVLLLNINTSNSFINYIQSRVDLTSFFLIEDNRLATGSEQKIANFISSGGIDLLFGNGRDAALSDVSINGSSYKMLLYDYGIIGLILYVFFFIYCGIRKRKIKNLFPFLGVFIASAYQRPFVFTILYVSIFLTAVTYYDSYHVQNIDPKNIINYKN